jgi:hypothetical protein
MKGQCQKKVKYVKYVRNKSTKNKQHTTHNTQTTPHKQIVHRVFLHFQFRRQFLPFNVLQIHQLFNAGVHAVRGGHLLQRMNELERLVEALVVLRQQVQSNQSIMVLILLGHVVWFLLPLLLRKTCPFVPFPLDVFFPWLVFSTISFFFSTFLCH